MSSSSMHTSRSGSEPIAVRGYSKARETGHRFASFAWALLAYNFPVILWGAYVRASFSGDGCGAHWPSCNGQMLPTKMATPMAIEFTHRMMTGVDTIAMVVLCVWAFRVFPRKNAVRRFAVLSLVFLVIEALLGAGLVLFRLVAKDQSAGRAWYLSAHLTNTMLLLGALTATAWLAQTNITGARFRSTPKALWVALCTAVAVSITGAIAALGDTLFPAASLPAGLSADFATGTNLLLRLRMLHPILAVTGVCYVLFVCTRILKQGALSGAYPAATRVIVLSIAQLAIGAANIALLAPLGMQLIHLAMADVVWVALVVLTLRCCALSPEPQTT